MTSTQRIERDLVVERLVDLVAPRLARLLGREIDEEARRRLLVGMEGLKQRAKTLVELAENAAFYVRPRPIPLDERALRLLDEEARARLARLKERIETTDFSAELQQYS